jgi:ferredoxin
MVRETTLTEFQKNPKFAKEGLIEEGKPFPEGDEVVHPAPRWPCYAELEYDTGEYQWGMVIDLGACTGCNTCIVACQAENNIIDRSARTRSGAGARCTGSASTATSQATSPDDPQVVHQPLGCMHCENAPARTSAPCRPPSHSPEGLNDMVVQPLHRHPVLRQQLPVQGPAFQLLPLLPRG